MGLGSDEQEVGCGVWGVGRGWIEDQKMWKMWRLRCRRRRWWYWWTGWSRLRWARGWS